MGLLVGLCFGLPLEQTGQSLNHTGLPGTEHVRMDLEIGSDLVERSLFLEGFKNRLGLQFG
jgi:hypothetical protein